MLVAPLAGVGSSPRTNAITARSSSVASRSTRSQVVNRTPQCSQRRRRLTAASPSAGRESSTLDTDWQIGQPMPGILRHAVFQTKANH